MARDCSRSADHRGPFNDTLFSHWGIKHGRLPQCTWDRCFNTKLCRACGAGDDGRLQPVRVYARGENKHGPNKGLTWARAFAASKSAGLVERVGNASEACVVIEPLYSQKHAGLEHANRLLVVPLRGDRTLAERAEEMKIRTIEDFVGRAMVVNDNWVRQVRAVPSSGVSPLG